MGLENTTVVDAIGWDAATNEVALTIFDAFNWDREKIHLLALQDKLNTYFDFVQSKQIYESYPKATNNSIRIDIIADFPPSKSALEFLIRASDAGQQLNIKISHKLLADMPKTVRA